MPYPYWYALIPGAILLLAFVAVLFYVAWVWNDDRRLW